MNVKLRVSGRLFCALVCSLAFHGAHAVMTPAQALDYRIISDLHFSPDGQQLTYLVRSYRQESASHLWLMQLATGQPQEITPAGKSERGAQWSPDGKRLAFLSSRDGRPQIYAMPAAGGAPVRLTQQKAGVQGFRWSPDGRAIAYLALADDAPGGDIPQIADDPRKLAALWLLDLGSQQTRRLGAAGYRIDDAQWQDRSHLLLNASATPRSDAWTNAIYRLSIEDGRLEELAQPPLPFSGLVGSPDGQAFAVTAPGAGGPKPRDLYVAAGAGRLQDVSLKLDRAIAEVRWPAPGSLWVRAVEGFHNRIYRLSLSSGSAPQRIELPWSVDAFDAARDGRIAFAGGDFDRPEEIYLRTADGHVRQLTHLQQGLDQVPLAAAEIFHVRSFDGTDIEAALLTPSGARPRAGWPLVLRVHGGPASNFTAAYGWEAAWSQMLAGHGYQALLVNPRGSNGYSEAFLKANRGDWGGGDYRDLMAVLDAVLARGQTDPGRLGIGGWSYGGEMSVWATTQSERFKAAVAGAPVYDQMAEYESEDVPAGDEWYFGTPWEHPEVYARNSPASRIAHAHTPTLILDGADDQNNPLGQSVGLYRALKHFGVETQLVVYPDEDHAPARWSSNLDMFERILAWYDQHLAPVP